MTRPLSFDHLQAILRQHTAGLPDVRKPSPNTRYTIQNAALGAFGIFFMQSPSFLEYQRQLNQRQGHDNAQTLFGVEPIPCDNQIRTLLDPIAPSYFTPVFFEVFAHLEQQHLLDPFRVLDQQLLVSLDGTQYFSSKTLHCQNCLTRQLSNGQTLYHRLSVENVAQVAQAGRGRWKIENENNNVLKTKGYHLEHNFGHGQRYLSATMLSRNLLAFLCHTVLEWSDAQYALLRPVLARRQTCFEDMRALTRYMVFESWPHLMDFMIKGLKLESKLVLTLRPKLDTS